MRIVRHVVLHGEVVVPIHKRRQLKILGTHFGTRTPTRSIVNPRSSLRIEGIVRALLHDFPAPLDVVIDLHAVGVVTEFRTVVALTKVVPTRPRFQSPHLLVRTGRVGLGQNGLVPVVQVMDALPKCSHIFHIPRRRPFDERKFQIEQLLPIAAFKLHAVFEERSVVRHVKHPGPALGPESQVDAIWRDVA